MNSNVKAITNYFIRRPGTVFLADSLGALFTALFLLIWRNFSGYIGIPKTTLTYLFVIAVCFCLYSAACYVVVKENRPSFLRIISIANFIYCVLTMGILIAHCAQITTIGLIYFLAEMIIICGLAYIELNVAKAIRNHSL